MRAKYVDFPEPGKPTATTIRGCSLNAQATSFSAIWRRSPMEFTG